MLDRLSSQGAKSMWPAIKAVNDWMNGVPSVKQLIENEMHVIAERLNRLAGFLSASCLRMSFGLAEQTAAAAKHGSRGPPKSPPSCSAASRLPPTANGRRALHPNKTAPADATPAGSHTRGVWVASLTQPMLKYPHST